MKTGFRLLLFAALVTAGLGLSARAQDGPSFHVEIEHFDTLGLMRALDQAGFDVAGRDAGRSVVGVVASAGELDRLAALGLSPVVIKSSAVESIPSGYHDFAAIVQMLADFETNHPSLAKRFDLGQDYGPGTTYEGRKIWALKISDNVAQEEDEPAILIVARHHAREIVTPELALHYIDQLLTNYGSDPDITRWVDNNEIWISPVWNPDGLEYCWNTYDYWRKNRKPAGSGYYGIDLNRNYHHGWDDPWGSGSTWPGSDTYKGPSADSEEETQTMIDFAMDQWFAKVLDLHSYGEEVLYTYYYSSSMPSQIESWYASKAQTFSHELGYYGSSRKPSATGEHYHMELNDLGNFAFLAETASDFQPPYSSAQYEQTRTWPGVKWFLDHEIPIYGHVTEAGTGTPIVADIDIAGLVYPEGDKHQSRGDFGRLHYFLPPGTYTATISSAGYTSRAVQVTAVDGESTLLETQLGTEPALTVTGIADIGQALDLEFDWPSGAGRNYICAASWIDTGFQFPNGDWFPIGRDSLFNATAGKLPGFSGTLDAAGHASTTLSIPNNAAYAGRTFHLAWFAYQSSVASPLGISAKVTVTLGV